MTLEYPDDLKYLDSHEYVRLDGEIATVGITAFAIEQLGDIVFLELAEVGEALTKEEKFGTVESVKAVEELYAPITGTVVERNDLLIKDPQDLAEDPYGEGWLLKVKIKDSDELEEALSADQYRAMVDGE